MAYFCAFVELVFVTKINICFQFRPAKSDENSPFPSSGLPLCQNELKCETILMKMCFTYKFIFMQVKLIFIRKVLHEESF